VHVQGSFGLGTVIPPISDEEHYDVDAVCEFRKLNKSQTTQQNVKNLLGDEMKLYAKRQNMNKPPEEHHRCWRLEYADGAQFHMDVTPGLLNAAEQRALLLSRGLDARFADTAIAITDIDHHAYRILSVDWPRSNPRGYLKWFLGRMEVIFEQRKRELIRKGVRADTEPIPVYAVRTPLQSAVMILKRHRDIMFVQRSDERPISIILTTLAAHAYNGETKISDALFAILNGMDRFIGKATDGSYVVPNDMAAEILVDAGDGPDARFVTALHRDQHVLRMFVNHLAVEHAVVGVADQHEVVGIVRQLEGPLRVSARSLGRVRHNVSDVGRVGVRGAGYLVADQEPVAARVLTAACGTAPDDALDSVGDRLAPGLRLRADRIHPTLYNNTHPTLVSSDSRFVRLSSSRRS
jgi:hypothetical protein